jgi:hypothetical protein
MQQSKQIRSLCHLKILYILQGYRVLVVGARHTHRTKEKRVRVRACAHPSLNSSRSGSTYIRLFPTVVFGTMRRNLARSGPEVAVKLCEERHERARACERESEHDESNGANCLFFSTHSDFGD